MKAPVVVKVGGSLFHDPRLKSRLYWIIRQCAGAPMAFVAGGGASADEVRGWHSQHQLDDQTSHWLAIRAMGLGERLLLSLLIPSIHAHTSEDLERAKNASQPVVIDMETLLRIAEGRGNKTPQASWDVTSDSLAAWAADRIGSTRLILAKSIGKPDGDATRASSEGLVDAAFLTHATGLMVDWVNLKSDSPVIERWF